jgi:hypothetical protein
MVGFKFLSSFPLPDGFSVTCYLFTLGGYILLIAHKFFQTALLPFIIQVQN